MEKTLEQKVSNVRRIVGYLLPLAAKYDFVRERETLQKNPNLAEVSYREIDRALKEAYQEERLTLYLGRMADSADKITSAVGLAIETFGLGFGLAPGFVLNYKEELIEKAWKLPFLIKVGKDKETRAKIYPLLIKDGLTFAAPVAGDIYDFVANSYVGTSKEIIREKAIEKILRGYKK
jgi:hypothetical protein